MLPEAKSEVAWRDRDTLYVGTDFGPGSLTSSGYPRLVKEWRRGTPLAQARAVFEGKAEDVSVAPMVVSRMTGLPFSSVPAVPPEAIYNSAFSRAQSDVLGSYSPVSGI